ncbi:oligosaccharide flippase family protein, partial [Vibrio campbellii]|uniref:oligosaccharide flippase family protein n=1 Tax=Vibrio campbellii TaxID=680 RepID=UPI000AAA15E3
YLGGQLLNQIRGNIDNAILGSIMGLSSLGVYSMAKQLIVKPTIIVAPIMQKVVLPVLAVVKQEPRNFKVFTAKSIRYIA